jgi:cell division transport system ATP-binding protein
MIKFQHVTQRFADGTVAFSNLSFSVDDGELVLITGPSGSGKTTIMNLILNEYQPVSGEIIFDDQPIKKIKRSKLPHHRRKIGVVFQDYKLIEELNVWENIALPLYIQGEKQADIEDRVTDLLKLVDLADKALFFPRQLSGGEAQRISIARALATGPSVIFADEPTGNLDEKTGDHIISLLTKINELGTTLIIATHDPLIIERLKTKVIDLAKLQAEIEDESQDKSEKEIQSDKKPLPEEKSPKPEVKEEKQPDDQISTEKKEQKSAKGRLVLPMNSDKIKSKLSLLFSKKKKSSQEKEKSDKAEKADEKQSKEEKKASASNNKTK